MKNILKVGLASILGGSVVGLVYYLFTWAVEELQHLVWFDFAKVDEYKFIALPLAILCGGLFAWLLHYFKVKGHQDIGHGIGDLIKSDHINVLWVVRSTAIGAASLVLGASLGPEAVLIPVSYGIGNLIAKGFKLESPQHIGIFGVVALLAAFFNTPLAGLLPLGLAAMLKTKDLKTVSSTIIFGLLATGSSVAVLRILDKTEGYVYLGYFDNFSMDWKLAGTALLIAAVATLIPFILDLTTKYLKNLFDGLKLNWLAGGLVAGLGIGLGYALLGPVAFFSGHTGLEELLHNNGEYTALQLGALAIGKLLLAAWSVATIYRGGTVFPLLLVAMSLALLFSGGDPNNATLVTLLAASFFGVFVGALGSLVVAAIFVFSVFGLQVWPIVLAASIGSILVKRFFKDKFTKQEIL